MKSRQTAGQTDRWEGANTVQVPGDEVDQLDGAGELERRRDGRRDDGWTGGCRMEVQQERGGAGGEEGGDGDVEVEVLA